jgi:hypothetical protein
MLAQLRAARRMVDAVPAPLRCIRVSALVPAGRTFRQWDTDGRAMLWVNRGDMARVPVVGVAEDRWLSRPSGFGVPVIID